MLSNSELPLFSELRNNNEEIVISPPSLPKRIREPRIPEQARGSAIGSRLDFIEQYLPRDSRTRRNFSHIAQSELQSSVLPSEFFSSINTSRISYEVTKAIAKEINLHIVVSKENILSIMAYYWKHCKGRYEMKELNKKIIAYISRYVINEAKITGHNMSLSIWKEETNRKYNMRDHSAIQLRLAKKRLNPIVMWNY